MNRLAGFLGKSQDSSLRAKRSNHSSILNQGNRRDCFGPATLRQALGEVTLAMAKSGFFRQSIAAVLVVYALSAGSIMATDFPNSHDMAVGGTFLLSASAPTTLVNAPGCAPPPYRLGVEIGYDRKYDLGDMDHLFIVGAARHKKFSGALGLAQFGKSDLYAERAIKASATYSPSALSFGLSATLFQVEFGNNYGRFSTQTVGAGIGYSMGRFLGLVVAENLTRPRLMPTAKPYPLTGSLNLEWSTIKRLSILARVIKTEQEKIKYGLGQRIPLMRTSALFWGISTQPLEYGAGIDIGARWFTFTYAAKIHPVLGFSHNVSILLMRQSHSKPSPDSQGSPGTMEDDFE